MPATAVLDSKNRLIRITVIGDFGPPAEVAAFHAELLRMLDTTTPDRPLDFLVDVHRAGKLSVEARQSMTAIGRDPRAGVSAIWGAGPYLRVIANFVGRISGRSGQMRFCATEEGALAWLKGK